MNISTVDLERALAPILKEVEELKRGMESLQERLERSEAARMTGAGLDSPRALPSSDSLGDGDF